MTLTECMGGSVTYSLSLRTGQSSPQKLCPQLALPFLAWPQGPHPRLSSAFACFMCHRQDSMRAGSLGLRIPLSK